MVIFAFCASLVTVSDGTSLAVCSSAVLGLMPVLILPMIALLSPSFGPLTMRSRASPFQIPVKIVTSEPVTSSGTL